MALWIFAIIAIATEVTKVVIHVSKSDSAVLQQNILLDSLLSASYKPSSNYYSSQEDILPAFVLNDIGGHRFNISSGKLSSPVNVTRQGDVKLKDDASGTVQFPFRLGSIKYQAQFSLDDEMVASGYVSADVSNVLLVVSTSGISSSGQGNIDVQITDSGQFDLKMNSTSSELLQYTLQMQKGVHEAIIIWIGQEAKADAARLLQKM